MMTDDDKAKVRLSNPMKNSRIAVRLVITTVVFSFFITLITTSVQLYFDYQRDLKQIQGYFQLIERSYLKSLSISVWMYDSKQVETQLDGLEKLPDMDYIAVKAGNKYQWFSGSLRSEHSIVREFPLTFVHKSREFEIGTLEVVASLDNVINRLIDKTFTILIANAVRAFLVSGFILVIFQMLVTRHLVHLARYLETIDLGRKSENFKLKRRKTRKQPDELDQVASAMNQVLDSHYQSYTALKESEEELSRVFSLSIDMICVADINSATFIKVNPAFTEILGFAEEEFQSESFYRFIHPDDIESTKQVVSEKLKKGEKVINFENRHICKDGSYRWLRWVSRPDTEKGVTYAVAHDITQMKTVIKELEESHHRFLTVLDAIDAHVYVADMASYEILYMNDKMKKDYGDDLTGEICWSAFRGLNSPCNHCTNDRLLDINGRILDVRVWQEENPITGKWYMNYDRAIKWVDGRIVRMQIAMDITRLKAMEEELRQAHKMEAVGTLAGGIAHDFNNILGIIIGNTELALDDVPLWNPARLNLEEIKIAGLRAKDVVLQLLSFSRKSEQQRIPVRIAPIIEESVRLLRSSLPTTVEIKSDIQAGSETQIIKADPTQIQQVMINLCTNASHAMEPGGGILEISLSQVELDQFSVDVSNELVLGPYLQLRVKDTGHGIPPEIKERIFDPYFTTKEIGKGSGMGLAIVHGIVMNHDGAIRINSQHDRGTTVEVLFPVCREELIKDNETHKIQPGGSERILLVDDEKSIAVMMKQMLERLGYTVECRLNPVDALASFSRNPEAFDLIITDMTMPQMTGDQFAEALLKIRQDIAIIICTGYSELMDPEKAEKIKVKGFLMKPVVKSEMARLVRKVLQ